ncbi:conserved hypothetical protein, partial [Ricinus communis]
RGQRDQVVQRGARHVGLAGRLVQRARDPSEQRERIHHAREVRVQAQRVLVGGDEQFVDAAPLVRHHFQRPRRIARVPSLQDAAHAVAQLVGVVGLGQEAVGARLQAAHDVLQGGQARQQQHGHAGQLRIVLQGAAQRIAVHARHGDVADDQVGRQLAGHAERVRAVRGHAHARRAMRVLRQHPGQVLGLRRAVFRHEDLVGPPGHLSLVRCCHPVRAAPGERSCHQLKPSVAGAAHTPAVRTCIDIS